MYLDELLTAAVLMLGASATAIVLFQRAGFGPCWGCWSSASYSGRTRWARWSISGPIAAAAELGVVFLLFVIGLELEPARIWAMRRTCSAWARCRWCSPAWPWRASPWPSAGPGRPPWCWLGSPLSSTAFVLQLLTERDELATEPGRAALAILLLQDMAVIPLLALVPLLAPGSDEPDAASIGWRFLVIAARTRRDPIARRVVLPRAFAAIARQRSSEAFAVLAVLAVLAAAWLAAQAELSPALGAFVVGVLLSGSPFHHQVAAEVTPFKGLLLGLFFISVGMSIDLRS